MSHYDTPTKAKVQRAHEYMLIKGLAHDSRDIFDHFGVKHTQGYQIIRSESSRQRAHQSLIKTRGRKCKMTPEQVREADHLLQEDYLEFEAKGLI